MPAVRLRSTNGRCVDVHETMRARTRIYCYPRTGRLGEEIGPAWDEIPGARRCTPETCTFRDHHVMSENSIDATTPELAPRGVPRQRLVVQELESLVCPSSTCTCVVYHHDRDWPCAARPIRERSRRYFQSGFSVAPKPPVDGRYDEAAGLLSDVVACAPHC